jgi:hypothetical protein
MVHLPEFGLMQTALRTALRRTVQGPGPGLDSGNDKTHGCNLSHTGDSMRTPEAARLAYHFTKIHTIIFYEADQNITDL